MNCRQQLVGCGGNDRARIDRVAVDFPTVPHAGKGEWCSVLHLKVVGLRDLLTDSLPFVKTVCRNQAASSLKRLAEGWLFIDRLHARIDEPLRLFAPERNQAPLQLRDLSNRVTFEDGQDVLGRRDVIPRDDIVQIERIDESLELYPLRCFKRESSTHCSI